MLSSSYEDTPSELILDVAANIYPCERLGDYAEEELPEAEVMKLADGLSCHWQVARAQALTIDRIVRVAALAQGGNGSIWECDTVNDADSIHRITETMAFGTQCPGRETL